MLLKNTIKLLMLLSVYYEEQGRILLLHTKQMEQAQLKLFLTDTYLGAKAVTSVTSYTVTRASVFVCAYVALTSSL